jgi:formylglycine-generating enzyme required for sulfatase activity
MVRVPGGKFFMGSDDDQATERPAHQVSVTSFCIDVNEVTVAEYKACSDQGECKRAPLANDWDGMNAHDAHLFDPLCNARDDTRSKHPVNCITWDMADRYCRAHDARLPTEAEWEFAARGPDGRKYPWGDAIPDATHLNACGKECVEWSKKNGITTIEGMYSADDGWAGTAPVGSFPAGRSRYGVADLAGNVAEWVADWYAPYTEGAQIDPKGPATGKMRVVRGGGWNASYGSWVRPTFRYRDTPDKRSYNIGFRCAAK